MLLFRVSPDDCLDVMKKINYLRLTIEGYRSIFAFVITINESSLMCRFICRICGPQIMILTASIDKKLLVAFQWTMG